VEIRLIPFWSCASQPCISDCKWNSPVLVETRLYGGVPVSVLLVDEGFDPTLGGTSDRSIPIA